MNIADIKERAVKELTEIVGRLDERRLRILLAFARRLADN